MPTLRENFHELGNWHNKMSMAAMVTKEALTQKEVTRLLPAELKKVVDKAVKTLGKIEQYVVGADQIIDEIKPFIYEKMGADTPIPTPKQEAKS